MSRNYVDENGNLIQIAGKGVGVAEWGTPIDNWLNGHTTSATAITADKDGVLFYSGSTNGALYEDNKVVFSEAQSGTNYFMYGVRKGHKYYGNPFVTSGKVYCVFFPFKENNNLQMVREKYSTEETVIGEWIDGKPIYRKVVMGNNTQYYDLSTCNIKDIMHMDAFCDNRNGSAKDCFMYSMDVKNSESIVYQETNKRLYVASVSNLIKYIIIEYTKNTD